MIDYFFLEMRFFIVVVPIFLLMTIVSNWLDIERFGATTIKITVKNITWYSPWKSSKWHYKAIKNYKIDSISIDGVEVNVLHLFTTYGKEETLGLSNETDTEMLKNILNSKLEKYNPALQGTC